MTSLAKCAAPMKVSGQAKVTGLLLAIGMTGVPGLSHHFFGLAMLNELVRLSSRVAVLRIPLAFLFLCGFVIVRTQGGVIVPGTAWLVAYMAVPAFAASFMLGREGAAHARIAVLAIVAGATAHALVNAMFIFRDHGVAPETRLFDDAWTGQLWNATGHASLWIPLIGALPFLLLGRETKRSALIGWFLMGAAVWAATALASRTMLLVLLVSLGLGGLIFLQRGGAGARVASRAAVGLVALVFVFLLIPADVLQRLPLVSRLSSDDSLGDDPRLERWGSYLSAIGNAPSGEGALERTLGYGHNIWLDAYDSEGFIPFILLVFFGVAFATGVLRVARKVQTEAALLLTGTGVAWFLQASTEPLIYLSPFIFIAGCGIAGATSGLVDHGRMGRAGEGDRPSIGQAAVGMRR